MSYRIKYSLSTEVGQFDGDHLRKEGAGGADALVLISCLYPEDGSYSQAVVSMDGRTGKEVSSADLWKAWTLLANVLAKRADLAASKRELCSETLEAVRAAILKAMP